MEEEKIWLYAGKSVVSRATKWYNYTMRKNASRADNQQGTTKVSYNLINHKWGTLRDYTPDTVELSDELVTLIALLYTDGGISKHRLNSWRIFFSNLSDVALALFRKCMIEIFKISTDRIKVVKMLERYHFATVTSKEIGNFLIKSFGHFRTLKYPNGTYPEVSIPVQELIQSDKARVFLRTAFSMDGGTKFFPVEGANGYRHLWRGITIACHHPKLREQYKVLLQSVGVESSNVESDRVIRIQRKENLEKFASEVGFLPGIEVTRHSKFWAGLEKNAVLDMMIDSYVDPHKYLSLSRFKR